MTLWKSFLIICDLFTESINIQRVLLYQSNKDNGVIRLINIFMHYTLKVRPLRNLKNMTLSWFALVCLTDQSTQICLDLKSSPGLRCTLDHTLNRICSRIKRFLYMVSRILEHIDKHKMWLKICKSVLFDFLLAERLQWRINFISNLSS